MVTLNGKTSKPQVFVKVNGYAGLREYQEAIINVISHACSDHDEMNCREFPNTIFHTTQILKVEIPPNVTTNFRFNLTT